MNTMTFAGSVLAGPERLRPAASRPMVVPVESEDFNSARAQSMAENFGVKVTAHEFGITVEGRRFVNHLASLDELAAWFIGYQAALASVDLLFCERPVEPDSAAASVRSCSGNDTEES